MKLWPVFLLAALLSGACRQQSRSATEAATGGLTELPLKYARGFAASRDADGNIYLTVNGPWPEAARPFRYVLLPRGADSGSVPNPESYDALIQVPARQVVLTSTTHIPALEALGEAEKLAGFPGLDYISSPLTRSRIEAGAVAELGANEQLNTEKVLELQPDLVVGFGVSEAPRSYRPLQAAGIPVVFNGDWMEQSPLGKAEWIKFFGLLLGREQEAESLFDEIEASYLRARDLASGTAERPTVLSGALYRDVWYLPAGESWAATFLRDAHATYLWADTPGTGSLSLSLEAVLEQGSEAAFWLAPSQFTSYDEMRAANAHFEQFRAFRERRVYTYARSTGPGTGLLYFELGPARPDWVLQDLIYYLHPGLLEGYEPVFFKPLE